MANTLQQMKRATEIVERYRARGNVFPRELRDCGRGDPVSQQEYRDACKVKTWKYSLLGKNIYNCSDEIRDYLDENMPGWRDRVYSHQGQSSSVQMKKAIDIVARYRERGCTLPRRLKDPLKSQETKDAINISTWKSSLKGYNRVTCSKELCDYLDANMPGWREDHHKSRPRSLHGREKAVRALVAGTTPTELEKKERSSEYLMPIAKDIVKRFNENGKKYPTLKLTCRLDPNRSQEYADAKQLHSWKSHTDPSLVPDVFEYLDTHMPKWKNSHINTISRNNPISKAREILRRCSMRRGSFPKHYNTRPTNPVDILEHKDAIKLSTWRRAFEENPQEFPENLRLFLDDKLSEWRTIDIESKHTFADFEFEDNSSVASNQGKHARKPSDRSQKKRKLSKNDWSSVTTQMEINQKFDETAGIEALLQLSSSNTRGSSSMLTSRSFQSSFEQRQNDQEFKSNSQTIEKITKKSKRNVDVDLLQLKSVN